MCLIAWSKFRVDLRREREKERRAKEKEKRKKKTHQATACHHDIGIGYYNLASDTGNVNYHSYWTQDFGKVLA